MGRKKENQPVNVMKDGGSPVQRKEPDERHNVCVRIKGFNEIL